MSKVKWSFEFAEGADLDCAVHALESQRRSAEHDANNFALPEKMRSASRAIAERSKRVSQEMQNLAQPIVGRSA
jgi:hypothetical protein